MMLKIHSQQNIISRITRNTNVDFQTINHPLAKKIY